MKKRHRKVFTISLIFCAYFVIMSNTYPHLSAEPYLPSLDLTFTGDLMAHTSNFNMKDYTLIYRDIEYITRNDDLTFTNLEVPVVADQPYQNYPNFNIQPPYVEAALAAGFDVFSLANNHTNDQFAKGITSTYNYFSGLEADGTVAAACGLKPEGSTDITYRIIEKNGFRVLFVAVTEILNTFKDMARIDYIDPGMDGKAAFISFCRELREAHPCDLFIVSMHVCEPEYVRTVTQVRKDYFHKLLDAGVDIIWANHPHVTQEWEVITDENGDPVKLIMYSMGNLISGQRYYYNYAQPGADREYTGDSLIMKVSAVKRDDGSVRLEFIQPLFITTQIDSERNFIIKRYTTSFLESLSETDKAYFTKRHELITKTTGTTVCR